MSYQRSLLVRAAKEALNIPQPLLGVQHVQHLAENRTNWSKRRNGMMKMNSVCDVCEEGTEDLKYCVVKSRDGIKSLEDLTEKFYKWKRPGECIYLQREGYNSMSELCRLAMKLRLRARRLQRHPLPLSP